MLLAEALAASAHALEGGSWQDGPIVPLLERASAAPQIELLATLARADVGQSPQRLRALACLLDHATFEATIGHALDGAGRQALARARRAGRAWQQPHPMVAPIPGTLEDVAADADADVQLAAGTLLRADDWSDSWERQRLNVGGAHLELTGADFVDGMILQSLALAGVDVRERIQQSFEGAPARPPVYFREPSFIPPDADSLGLCIDLAARVDRLSDPKLDAWIQPLRALPPTLPTPTWLVPGGGRGVLPGHACVAVRLALAASLLRWGRADLLPYADTNLRSVRTALDAGADLAGDYYGPEFTALLLQRCLHHARTSSQGHDVDLCAALDVHLGRFTEQMWRTQRHDGSVRGSVLATAHALELAASRPAPRLAIVAASRHLRAHQRTTGEWGSEAFYPTFGRDGRAVGHGGPSLTTALCLRGLANVRRALDLPQPDTAARTELPS